MLSQRTLKATPKYGKSLMTVTIRRSSVNDSLLHRALLKSFVTRMKYVSRSAWTRTSRWWKSVNLKTTILISALGSQQPSIVGTAPRNAPGAIMWRLARGQHLLLSLTVEHLITHSVEKHPPLCITRCNALSDRKSTRLNSSHSGESRMPSSA